MIATDKLLRDDINVMAVMVELDVDIVFGKNN
jgi:hypothetical protein